MTPRLPTYFISHGGGPWPWMEEMAPAMQRAAPVAGRHTGPAGPNAQSRSHGHRALGRPCLHLGRQPSPGMVYDYGGFPAHTYQVVYPAPGAPDLALRVQGLLEAAGLPVALDAQRGYDHGTFVPLAVMFPEAKVPVLQMSLRAGLDPAEHLALGRALAPLRDEGVLIVGSGLSYHNLRQFGRAGQAPSQAFDAWLQGAMAASPAARTQALLNWEQAPSARSSHPREEHLLPLMVAVGAAEAETASCVYHEEHVFGGVTVSSFRFGAVGN